MTIPRICCLVIGSLKKKKAKTTNRAGYDPAIGATIAVRFLLIAKLKLSSAAKAIIEAKKRLSERYFQGQQAMKNAPRLLRAKNKNKKICVSGF